MIKSHREKRLPENAQLRKDIDLFLDEGSKFLSYNFADLDIVDYKYDISNAVEILDLDEDLVHQLVEDYIIQILKSKTIFYKYIKMLQLSQIDNKPLDYENIKNLAHKNLGVVRNLHIEDAQKLLTILMNNNEGDFDYLRKCVRALEATASKLIPLCAYETLKLIEVKNAL